MKRSIEGKVRPQQSQETPNQRNAAKVYVHPVVLAESGISSGSLCNVEGANGTARHEAVAWASADKNVGKNVVLLSRAILKLAAFELGEVIRVTDAGEVPEAESVVVRDVSPEGLPVVPADDLAHVAYNVEIGLGKADYVFAGLTINDVEVKGHKRSYVVESVNGSKTVVAKAGALTRVSWYDEDAGKLNGTFGGKLEVTGVPGMAPQLKKLNAFFRYFGKQLGRTSRQLVSCGIAIQGSPGTGKSMLLDRIAETRWGKVIRLRPSEKPSIIREHFDNALVSQKPTIILIDDITQEKANRPALEAIYEGLDALARRAQQRNQRPDVVVVASCLNYLEDLPEFLKSKHCFDQYIALPIPDVPARKEIIRYFDPNFSPENYEQFVERLGERTHAYTGRDLEKLILRACMETVERIGDESTDEPIIWDDIMTALKEVPPTAMNDIALKPPTVHWSDIGGYKDVKETLQRVLRRPKTAMWKPPKGVLLYGPPGCSKTMTAQAMATESGFNFFAVKGGELLNMYVGETERSIRNLFKRARDASPSIIFFDEIDSLAGLRSGPASHGGVQALTTLLTEMDGFEQLGNVFVLAATNKPASIDPALLRPGRFDELIYVPLPDQPAREAIFSRKAKELHFPPVDIHALAKLAGGYSGAEISRLCDGAFGVVADDVPEGSYDPMEIIQTAFRNTPRLVTDDILMQFKIWRNSRTGI